jgi:hypothetical protein
VYSSLYGGVSVQGDEQTCFYDAKGIVQTPDRHIRVWTECLARKDLDSIDIEKAFGGKILRNTAAKIARYYMPPIGNIETIDVYQAMTITQYEETANIGGTEPRAQIFYELNCPDRMIRELSIHIVDANGKRGALDTASNWKYVAPEGNAASLLKLLCPQQNGDSGKSLSEAHL